MDRYGTAHMGWGLVKESGRGREKVVFGKWEEALVLMYFIDL